MKFLYFDDFRLGVLSGETVVDVTALVEDLPHRDRQDLIGGLIANFEKYRARLEKAAQGNGIPLSQVSHSPATAAPLDRRLHGGQLHGRRHARSAPAPINAFNKSPKHDHRPRRHHGA